MARKGKKYREASEKVERRPYPLEEAIGLVDRMIRVPRVVVLTAYDRVPRRNVRFCRRNTCSASLLMA